MDEPLTLNIWVGQQKSGRDDCILTQVESSHSPSQAPARAVISTRDWPDLLTDAQWYLEKYIYEDAFYEVKANRVRKALEDACQNLAVDLDLEALVRDAPGTSKLHINIINACKDEPGTGNLVFAIPWELLESHHLWTQLPLSVTVRRLLSPHAKPTVAHSREVISEAHPLHILIIPARRITENQDTLQDIPPYLALHAILDAASQFKARHGKDSIFVDVVRPGSWQALQQTLADRAPGYYDLVHFDVHGSVRANGVHEPSALLHLLKSDSSGDVEGILMARVARLLQKHKVRTVVLNSCNTASSQHGVEANAALCLQRYGLSSILAMSHKASAVAVGIFLSAFYRDLFQGHDFAQASAHARRALSDQPCRRAKYALERPLMDSFVPVTYTATETAWRIPVDTSFHQEQTVSNDLPDESHGIIGRDFDLLRLEACLMRHKIVLLHGPAGVGKSCLVARGVSLWQQTQHFDYAISIDMAEGVSSFNDFCRKVLEHVPGQGRNARPAHASADLNEFRSFMQTHKVALFVDHVQDSISAYGGASQPSLARPEWKLIQDALAELAGDEMPGNIVVVARNASCVGEELRRHLHEVRLDGLEPGDARLLFKTELQRQDTSDQAPSQADAEASDQLLCLVEYNPSAIKWLTAVYEEQETSLREFFDAILHWKLPSHFMPWFSSLALLERHSLVRDALKVYVLAPRVCQEALLWLAYYWLSGPTLDTLLRNAEDEVEDEQEARGMLRGLLETARDHGFISYHDLEQPIPWIHPLWTLAMRYCVPFGVLARPHQLIDLPQGQVDWDRSGVLLECNFSSANPLRRAELHVHCVDSQVRVYMAESDERETRQATTEFAQALSVHPQVRVWTAESTERATRGATIHFAQALCATCTHMAALGREPDLTPAEAGKVVRSFFHNYLGLLHMAAANPAFDLDRVGRFWWGIVDYASLAWAHLSKRELTVLSKAHIAVVRRWRLHERQGVERLTFGVCQAEMQSLLALQGACEVTDAGSMAVHEEATRLLVEAVEATISVHGVGDDQMMHAMKATAELLRSTVLQVNSSSGVTADGLTSSLSRSVLSFLDTHMSPTEPEGDQTWIDLLAGQGEAGVTRASFAELKEAASTLFEDPRPDRERCAHMYDVVKRLLPPSTTARMGHELAVLSEAMDSDASSCPDLLERALMGGRHDMAHELLTRLIRDALDRGHVGRADELLSQLRLQRSASPAAAGLGRDVFDELQRRVAERKRARTAVRSATLHMLRQSDGPRDQSVDADVPELTAYMDELMGDCPEDAARLASLHRTVDRARDASRSLAQGRFDEAITTWEAILDEIDAEWHDEGPAASKSTSQQSLRILRDEMRRTLSEATTFLNRSGSIYELAAERRYDEAVAEVAQHRQFAMRMNKASKRLTTTWLPAPPPPEPVDELHLGDLMDVGLVACRNLDFEAAAAIWGARMNEVMEAIPRSSITSTMRDTMDQARVLRLEASLGQALKEGRVDAAQERCRDIVGLLLQSDTGDASKREWYRDGELQLSVLQATSHHQRALDAGDAGAIVTSLQTIAKLSPEVPDTLASAPWLRLMLDLVSGVTAQDISQALPLIHLLRQGGQFEIDVQQRLDPALYLFPATLAGPRCKGDS